MLRTDPRRRQPSGSGSDRGRARLRRPCAATGARHRRNCRRRGLRRPRACRSRPGQVTATVVEEPPPGVVVSTDPPAGSAVPRDQPVDVVVTESAPSLMPHSVTGLLGRRPPRRFADSPLVISYRNQTVAFDDSRSGRVIAQSIPAGTPGVAGHAAAADGGSARPLHRPPPRFREPRPRLPGRDRPGQLQRKEVADQVVTGVGQHRLRWNALDVEARGDATHDQPVVGLRGDLQHVGRRRTARRPARWWQVASGGLGNPHEDPHSPVCDEGGLAVHHLPAHTASPPNTSPDALEAQAHAEHTGTRDPQVPDDLVGPKTRVGRGSRSGLMRMPSGSIRSTSASPGASSRCTSGSAPSSPGYCTPGCRRTGRSCRSPGSGAPRPRAYGLPAAPEQPLPSPPWRSRPSAGWRGTGHGSLHR